ncbi:MAG TPA: hypothetical protein VNV42_03305 [Solirubrobacteraceae bacterium]|nr:hypothetical protein [Solirubrobacteraceae bacterium]
MAVIAILLIHGSTGLSQVDYTSRVVLTIQPKHPGKGFAEGAIGLSIETRELATSDLSASDKSLVELMRLLGPGVLRIGGNSLDDSWWTSGNEPAPTWAKSVIVPTDLGRLRGLLAATGWRAILGVNLGHFEPVRAANEAEVAEGTLGARLLGFEIGNEPSDYEHPHIGLRANAYSANDYLGELNTYSAAMRASVPTISFYGPDLGSSTSESWLWPVASQSGTLFSSIDVHYYPTHYSVAKGACEAAPVPTASELLSPEVRENENAELQVMIKAGELAHRGVRISETNDTSSCDLPGGPATSPVYASALWSLDWSLRAASAGIVGLNFHGYLGRCMPESFAPICEPTNGHVGLGRVAPRPEYYGLLAARQLEGGRFIPTHLTSPSPLPNLVAWATVTPRGTVRVAIENFSTEGAAPISIPASGYAATYHMLAGPSIEATSGVTFGGVGVTAAGRWQPGRRQLSCRRGSCRIVVGPANAAIVTLRPVHRHRKR